MSNVIPFKPRQVSTASPDAVSPGITEEEKRRMLDEIEQIEQLAKSIRARYKRPGDEDTLSITARLRRLGFGEPDGA